MNKSYFDGNVLHYIGCQIIVGLISICTLGLGSPWAICYFYRWETKHTIIDGRRLRFDGTGAGLFGKWIIWVILTIITFGIYGFWLYTSLMKWKTKHTHFENDSAY